MEEKVTFLAGGLRLEGLLFEGNSDNGVVITHPHPQYGGDMYNPVVEATADAYRKAGWTTLRFNFRGSGQSEGSFDQGRGEQLDVLAAISYLQERGCHETDLAGYSFGAWINGLTFSRPSPPTLRRMIMISPQMTTRNSAQVVTVNTLERRDHTSAPAVVTSRQIAMMISAVPSRGTSPSIVRKPGTVMLSIVRS